MKILPLNNYPTQEQKHTKHNTNFGMIAISKAIKNRGFKLSTANSVASMESEMKTGQNGLTFGEFVNISIKLINQFASVRKVKGKNICFAFNARKIENYVAEYLKECNKILEEVGLEIPYVRKDQKLLSDIARMKDCNDITNLAKVEEAHPFNEETSLDFTLGIKGKKTINELQNIEEFIQKFIQQQQNLQEKSFMN